jgi:hypothetical protein
MFLKVEKFRLFASRRRAPSVITPANDNRLGARRNGARRPCPPVLACRWSEIDGAKRLACRWKFEEGDEPSSPGGTRRSVAGPRFSQNCLRTVLSETVGGAAPSEDLTPYRLRCAIERFDCVARTSLDDAI